MSRQHPHAGVSPTVPPATAAPGPSPSRAGIRPYHPDDREQLYRICLETGDAGDDATGLYQDPDLLGHVFVGPYVALEPDLAFVVADADGVGGYVLGVADTPAFQARTERQWWPVLRERYPCPSPDRAAQWTRDERVTSLIHRPWTAPQDVLREYPSHLHIDLLPRCQGSGYGRRLIDTLARALGAAGSPGVHLGVNRANERAIGFYRHLGFAELEVSETGLLMGLRL